MSLAEYVDSIKSANHEIYLAKSATKVVDQTSFDEMKSYLVEHYGGIEALHSFVDDNNSIFDCIRIEQQPALKNSGKKIPEPPDLSGLKKTAGTNSDKTFNRIELQLNPDIKDKFGNVRSCPPGTIAVRRITLDELTRFQNLKHFFQKTPGDRAQSDRLESADPSSNHRWAHAYQNTGNFGGHSFLSLWDPQVQLNQFSLSQHWYTAGNSPYEQTLEVGWQVFPQKYFTNNPVFFIYWTADGYHNTGGYNLDVPGFVQTSNLVAIGEGLNSFSISDGTQYEIEVAVYLYQGNWWLYLQGIDSSHAIGYFPASIYQGGPMANESTEVDYGGEVVGTTSWPPMGSGAFAIEGWQKAAYQRDIYYFDTAGQATNANLIVDQQWPQCYTANVVNYDPPWGVTLYYGGPGGMNC